MADVIYAIEYYRSKFDRRIQKATLPINKSFWHLYLGIKLHSFTIIFLSIFLGSHNVAYPEERKAEISYLSDPSLEFVHRNQLAKGADYYIRTSCSVVDYNIRFHGGCSWVLAWEANIGCRLGRGIRFIKVAAANTRAINFFFSRQPVEKITIKSVIKTRQELTDGCTYIVYGIDDGDLHASFFDQQKSHYNECIAKSIINYLYYSNRSMIKSGIYLDDLIRLYVALSGTESLEDDISSAVIVVDGITR